MELRGKIQTENCYNNNNKAVPVAHLSAHSPSNPSVSPWIAACQSNAPKSHLLWKITRKTSETHQHTLVCLNLAILNFTSLTSFLFSCRPPCFQPVEIIHPKPLTNLWSSVVLVLSVRCCCCCTSSVTSLN